MLTMDSLLCLCVVGSLAAAHAAIARGRLRWRWWLAAALACGCGVLAKGPVAVALVAPPIACLAFLDPRTARLRARHLLGFGVVFGIVAAPWYVALAAVHREFVGHFFWKHNVLRYVAPFDHPE